MKKLIAMFALAAISFTVVAQTAPATKPTPVKRMNDMMILRQGKVMIFKDGHMSPMDKPTTMKNGTVVTPTGMMTMKDGTTKQMAEGERLDMDGNMIGNRPAATPQQPTPQNTDHK